MTMQELKQGLGAFKINRQPSPVQLMGYPKPTREVAWFQHENLLGIVLYDNVDSDWSFVALSDPRGSGYTAFELGVSFKTQAEATKALELALNRGDI